ncbi:MAG: EF-hand domain-containing protein, partial [Pseudomonadota bacterium]
MKTSFTAAVAALLIAPTLAVAAPDGRAGMMFDRLDADGDGRITAAERSDIRDRMFNRLDADSDGVVTRAEAEERRTR